MNNSIDMQKTIDSNNNSLPPFVADHDYLQTMNLKLQGGNITGQKKPNLRELIETKNQLDKMIEGMISPKGSTGNEDLSN